MRLIKIVVREMNVIGCDERQPAAIGQFDETHLRARLFRGPLAHQLDIKPVREGSGKLAQHSFGGFGLAFGNEPRDRPLRPSSETNQALAAPVKSLRLIPGSLGISPAR